ncbi:MAG TPA: sugar transferase, partial [Gemmatimonadaceae bacterium]
MISRAKKEDLFGSYTPPAAPSGIDPSELGPPRVLTPIDAFEPSMRELRVRAAKNLRRHTWRVAARIGALLAADIGAFVLLRAALRLVREHVAMLSSGEARFIRWLFAEGYLGGWQFAVALVVSLVVTGNYGPGDRRRSARRIFVACALAVALPIWARLWDLPFMLTAGRYVLTVAPSVVVLMTVRFCLDRLVARYAPHPHSGAVARTILVGEAGECIEMRGRPAFAERSGFTVKGFVDVQTPPARGSLGSVEDLERILLEHRIEAIVLCGYVDDGTIVQVVRAATTAECQVLAVARRYEVAGVRPTVVWRRQQPFIELRAVGLRGHQLVLKRCLDVGVSALALALSSPVMLLVWVAVRLESDGPAIFGQRRVGRHGETFTCYKFRSMYVDAERRLQQDPELYRRYIENDYKLPEGQDTRITRVGRFLRR